MALAKQCGFPNDDEGRSGVVFLRFAKLTTAAMALVAAMPASADTTAVYQAKRHPVTMTVEIADNGSVRYQMSTGRTYGLVLNDVDYFITLEPSGPVVDRAADLVVAQNEAMAAFVPALPQQDLSAGPQLVPMGKVTINGRAGQAYGYKPEAAGATAIPTWEIIDNPDVAQLGKITTRQVTESEVERAMAAAVVVISDDPRLAQVGKAMSKQFGTSLALMTGVIGRAPDMFTEMHKLLQSGAPLSFAGMELKSVNHAPIDPKRFELPAPPQTLDQIRARLRPLPAPPTAKPEQP